MAKGSLASGLKVARIYGITIRLHLSWLIILGLFVYSLSHEILPLSDLVDGGFWGGGAVEYAQIQRFEQTHPDMSRSLVDEHFGITRWPEWQYWALGTVGAMGLFICVLAHELAHSIVAKNNGILVEDVTLFVFGGVSLIKGEPRTPWIEFKVAVVGPLMSFFIGIACTAMYLGMWDVIPPQARALLLYFAFINIALVIFNLIPGFPLDGGRLLRAILWSILGDLRRATAIASGCGKAFAGLLIIVGGYQILQGSFGAQPEGFNLGAIWWVVIGLFLWNAAKQGYQQMAVRQAFDGLFARDLLQRQVVAVGPDITLTDLVDRYFYTYRFHTFPVVEADGRGRPQADQAAASEVSGTQKEAVIPSEQSESRNLSVAEPSAGNARQDPSISLGVTANDAIPKDHAAPEQAASEQGDRLVGIISLRDVQAVPRTDWPVRRVRDVMRPAGEADSVRPDEDLMSVFRKLMEADRGHLPVVEAGRLVGIVTRRDVLNLLQIRADLGGRPARRTP